MNNFFWEIVHQINTIGFLFIPINSAAHEYCSEREKNAPEKTWKVKLFHIHI